MYTPLTPSAAYNPLKCVQMVFPIVLLMLLNGHALAQTSFPAEPIDDNTQLGYKYVLPETTVFCGVDYRIELVELLDNWLLNEDPADTNPAQMHPLRVELLEYMEPFRNHAAMRLRAALQQKYPWLTSFEKIAVAMGPLQSPNSSIDWYSLLSPTGQADIVNKEEYNNDLREFVQSLGDLIRDSDYTNWCLSHRKEYKNIVSELNETTDNAAIILDLLREGGFSHAYFYLIPSPMVTPGHNYMTVASTDLSTPIVYSFGPYKLIKEGIFKYASYSECEISFDCREQFIQLAIHEVAHLGNHRLVEETLSGREAELNDYLTPLSKAFEKGYGPLPESTLTYIDELVTRAMTLESIRRYLGEPSFRLNLVLEVSNSQGYSAFMWRYLYLDNNCFNDQEALRTHISGLPEEMKTWSNKGLDDFASLNEYSMTLGGWFREFIPTFYAGNPESFGIFLPDTGDEEWCETFRQQLITKLHVPEKMQLVDSEAACPFIIEAMQCDAAELLNKASATGLDCRELKELVNKPGAHGDIAVIHKEPVPGTGVRVTWYLNEGASQLQSVVPYYFPQATDIIVADGKVLAMDAFTSEVNVIMDWIKDKKT